MTSWMGIPVLVCRTSPICNRHSLLHSINLDWSSRELEERPKMCTCHCWDISVYFNSISSGVRTNAGSYTAATSTRRWECPAISEWSCHTFKSLWRLRLFSFSCSSTVVRVGSVVSCKSVSLVLTSSDERVAYYSSGFCRKMPSSSC